MKNQEKSGEEEQLKRLANFTMENARDAILWIGPKSRIIYCNQAACLLLGYTKEEVIGKHPGEISPALQPDGQDSVSKAETLNKEVREGSSQLFEWVHHRKDGSEFIAEVKLHQITIQDEMLSLAVLRDITERKDAEAAAQEERQRLARDLHDGVSQTLWSASLIADVLPEEKRADGFGILRVVANLAVVIGPAIGGLLATRSYTLLFIIDVITSVITAAVFFLFVPETKPEVVPDPGEIAGEDLTLFETLAGYLKVTKDQIFMVFLMGSVLMVLAYMQMNTTLSVYLRDVHGIPDRGYGLLLSMNAAMVVLFQFWITRKIRHLAPMKVMAWGMVIYAVGFSMYGFVSTIWLFVTAMVIITIAEMLVSPVGQAIVAKLSPEDMRGRYMAVYGFSWTIPMAIGPLAAGLIMDNYDPNWVWYASGIIMLLAGSIFAGLQLKAAGRFENINGDKQTPELEVTSG